MIAAIPHPYSSTVTQTIDGWRASETSNVRKGYHLITRGNEKLRQMAAVVSAVALPILFPPILTQTEFLRSEIVREARLKKDVIVSSVIRYMISDCKTQKIQCEISALQLQKQCDQIEVRIKRLQPGIAADERFLKSKSEQQEKLNSSIKAALDKAASLCNTPTLTLEQVPARVGELEKRAKELMDKSKLQTRFDRLQSAIKVDIKALLICPFSQKPLTDAVVVKIGNESPYGAINASYLGLKIVNGQIVKNETVQGKALDLLNTATSITWDITTSALAEKLFSENETNEIDLEDHSIRDPVLLETLQEPIMLECGHTFSKETVSEVNDCPLCRNPIAFENVSPNFVLNQFIKALQERGEAKKELETCQHEFAELPKDLEELERELDRCQDELSALYNVQRHLEHFNEVQYHYRKAELELSKSIPELKTLEESLKALKEKIKKTQSEADSLGKEVNDLILAFNNGDETLVPKIKQTKRELMKLAESNFPDS